MGYKVVIAQMAALNLLGCGIFDALIAQSAMKENINILLTLNLNQFNRLRTATASLVQVP